jgi:hypothetical protein
MGVTRLPPEDVQQQQQFAHASAQDHAHADDADAHGSHSHSRGMHSSAHGSGHGGHSHLEVPEHQQQWAAVPMNPLGLQAQPAAGIWEQAEMQRKQQAEEQKPWQALGMEAPHRRWFLPFKPVFWGIPVPDRSRNVSGDPGAGEGGCWWCALLAGAGRQAARVASRRPKDLHM